jgi:hypothetical protein
MGANIWEQSRNDCGFDWAGLAKRGAFGALGGSMGWGAGLRTSLGGARNGPPFDSAMGRGRVAAATTAAGVGMIGGSL